MVKTCSGCHHPLPLDRFYKNASRSSGFDPRCKDCERLRYRHRRARNNYSDKDHRYYLKHKAEILLKRQAYSRAHPARVLARELVKKAVRAGDLYKSSCEGCGTIEDVQAHHIDYTRPLDVHWLCRTCHARLHTQARVL